MASHCLENPLESATAASYSCQFANYFLAATILDERSGHRGQGTATWGLRCRLTPHRLLFLHAFLPTLPTPLLSPLLFQLRFLFLFLWSMYVSSHLHAAGSFQNRMQYNGNVRFVFLSFNHKSNHVACLNIRNNKYR